MAVRQRTIRLRRTLWLVVLFLLLPSLALSQPDPMTVGQWSSVVDWPQAPVHMTLQPDGTVVMWPAVSRSLQRPIHRTG